MKLSVDEQLEQIIASCFRNLLFDVDADDPIKISTICKFRFLNNCHQILLLNIVGDLNVQVRVVIVTTTTDLFKTITINALTTHLNTKVKG